MIRSAAALLFRPSADEMRSSASLHISCQPVTMALRHLDTHPLLTNHYLQEAEFHVFHPIISGKHSCCARAIPALYSLPILLVEKMSVINVLTFYWSISTFCM